MFNAIEKFLAFFGKAQKILKIVVCVTDCASLCSARVRALRAELKAIDALDVEPTTTTTPTP